MCSWVLISEGKCTWPLCSTDSTKNTNLHPAFYSDFVATLWIISAHKGGNLFPLSSNYKNLMFAIDDLISLKCSAIILHCCYMSRIDFVLSAPEQLCAERRKVHLQNTHRHQQKSFCVVLASRIKIYLCSTGSSVVNCQLPFLHPWGYRWCAPQAPGVSWWICLSFTDTETEY